ncbi:MAG: GNAT family N-acetyltransferase [Pseudobdellovibrionaceae bacterium]
MAYVRRARPEDAHGIHVAHMHSIQQICSQDHSEEEVRAWGNRPFREEQRLHAINNHLVWVIEQNNTIHGYGHLVIEERDGKKVGHVWGLYLTPEVKGQGLGHQIIELMLEEARHSDLDSIILESTITAYQFYKRIGFEDTGPQMKVEIAGVGVRCFPMELRLITRSD